MGTQPDPESDPGPDESHLKSYQELKVWKKTIDLVVEVYRLTSKYPPDERFGLTQQSRRASVSVPSNIAEGYGRRDRGDYLRHLSIANGSLKEVETQIVIAGRLKFVTKEEAKLAWALVQEVGKMLAALIASLKKDK